MELVASDGRLVLGDPASPVRCSGEDRSGRPLAGRPAALALPRLVGRAGVDRHPVDLSDVDAVRWLEACLWPDVPGRVERFRRAVRLVAGAPSPVVEGDMVDDLPDVLAGALDAATRTWSCSARGR